MRYQSRQPHTHKKLVEVVLRVWKEFESLMFFSGNTGRISFFCKRVISIYDKKVTTFH